MSSSNQRPANRGFRSVFPMRHISLSPSPFPVCTRTLTLSLALAFQFLIHAPVSVAGKLGLDPLDTIAQIRILLHFHFRIDSRLIVIRAPRQARHFAPFRYRSQFLPVITAVSTSRFRSVQLCSFFR